MNQSHSKQAQQHSVTAPQSTFLDQLFQTNRVIRMSMCASLTGMCILLALAYLLRESKVVLHLCILAVIMFILFVLLCIYKAMIGHDSQSRDYDRIHQSQEQKQISHHKNQIIDDDDNGSDSSSLVEVIPKKKQKKAENKEKNQKNDLDANTLSKQN